MFNIANAAHWCTGAPTHHVLGKSVIADIVSNSGEVNTSWLLIDTGAAVSIVLASVVARGGLEIVNVNNEHTVGITGHTLPIIGRCKVNFKLGNKFYEWSMLVSDDSLELGSDGLLGLDFLQYYGFRVELDTGRLTQQDNCIPLLDSNSIESRMLILRKETHRIDRAQLKPPSTVIKATRNSRQGSETFNNRMLDLGFSSPRAYLDRLSEGSSVETRLVDREDITPPSTVFKAAKDDQQTSGKVARNAKNRGRKIRDRRVSLLSEPLASKVVPGTSTAPSRAPGSIETCAEWPSHSSIDGRSCNRNSLADIRPHEPSDVNAKPSLELVSKSKPEGNILKNWVRLSERVFLPARSEYLCEGKQDQRSCKPRDGRTLEKAWIMEPVELNVHGALVSRTCILERPDHSLQVKLVNVTEKELDIPRNTIVGYIEEVDECKTSVVGSVSHSMNQDNVINDSVSDVNIDNLCNLEHVDIDDKAKIKGLLYRFKDLFFVEGQEIGCTSHVKHSIPTGDALPIKRPPYRVPYALRPVMEEHINDMCKKGIIRPSSSPWNSACLLVPKRSLDGKPKFRFCTDFRALNAVTKKDSYPLPLISDTLDMLGNAKYFTTLDLAAGYHQVEIVEEDREKTSFSTFMGKFEYNRVPFGAASAPAVFQRLMDSVLTGLTGVSCYTYLDDIVCFGRTIDEHLERLEQILLRLRRANLRLNPGKCHFLSECVEYLGHLVTSSGVKPNPSKIDVIKNHPVPKHATDIKSFVGIAGFYRRFVPNFAQITKPLQDLLKKGVRFEWGHDQSVAFNTLKEALTTAPILRYPDFSKQFVLTTDASAYALGCVLSQEFDGQDCAIAYASRPLNSAEKNYSTVERELTGVVWAVKHFRVYLYGQPTFKIYSDQRSLQWLINKENKSSRLTRWALELSEYNFQVQYKPGTSISHADGLSRLRVDAIKNLCEPIWDRERIRFEQRADPELKDLINKLQLDNSSSDDFALDEEGLLYKIRTGMQREDRLVVPTSMRQKVLRQYHDLPFAGHQGQTRCTQLINSKFYWKGLHSDVILHCQQCVSCNLRKSSPHAKRAPLQPYPEVLKPFMRVHVDLCGPFPISKSNNRYLLTFTDAFTRYVEAVPIPNQTAQTVAKALVTQIIGKYGNPEQLISDRGGSFVCKLLKEVCLLLKINHTCTLAYSPSSNGAVERSHRTMWDILSHYVNKSQDDWDEHVPYMLMAMRSAISSSTGESPHFLLYGYDLDLPFDCIIKPTKSNKNLDPKGYAAEVKRRLNEAILVAREHMRKTADRQERQYNKNSEPISLAVGDKVFLANPAINPKGTAKKLNMRFQGPMRIVKQNGVAFTVRDMMSGKQQTVHHNRLKKYNTFTLDEIEEIEDEEEKEEVAELTHRDDILSLDGSNNNNPQNTYDERDHTLFTRVKPSTTEHSTSKTATNTTDNSTDVPTLANYPQDLPLLPSTPSLSSIQSQDCTSIVVPTDNKNISSAPIQLPAAEVDSIATHHTDRHESSRYSLRKLPPVYYKS